MTNNKAGASLEKVKSNGVDKVASYVPPEPHEIDVLTEVNDDLYNYFCEKYSKEKDKDFIPHHEVLNTFTRKVYQFCFKPISDFMLNIAYKEMFENSDILAFNESILRNTLLNGEQFVFDEKNQSIKRALDKFIQKVVTPYDVEIKKRRAKPFDASFDLPSSSELNKLTEVGDSLYSKLCEQHSIEDNKEFLPFHVVTNTFTQERYEFCFGVIPDDLLNEAYKEMFDNNRYLGFNDIVLRNTLLNGVDFVFAEENIQVKRALERKVQKIITPYEIQVKKRKRTRKSF